MLTAFLAFLAGDGRSVLARESRRRIPERGTDPWLPPLNALFRQIDTSVGSGDSRQR